MVARSGSNSGRGNSRSNSNRGMASADPQTRREVGSMGGRAAARSGNTENRGFASMDERKQKEIASKGGRESHKNDGGGRSQGRSSMSSRSNDSEGSRQGLIEEAKTISKRLDESLRKLTGEGD